MKRSGWAVSGRISYTGCMSSRSTCPGCARDDLATPSPPDATPRVRSSSASPSVDLPPVEAPEPRSTHRRQQAGKTVTTASNPDDNVGFDSPLVIRLSGLRSAGKIRVAVFDDPDTFPDRNKATRRTSAEVDDSNVELTIDGLPAGRYAVAAFQDLNGDAILNKSGFGVPREPYGFSKNARGRFGPPSFAAAAFDFSSENRTVDISLR